MFLRYGLTLAAAAVLATAPVDGRAQMLSAPPTDAPPGWHGSGGPAERSSAGPAAAPAASGSAADAPSRRPSASPTPNPRRTVTRVTEGSGSLPNTQGQVWREYDISPYTVRVTATKRPEQAIVDWVLRETGYEAWHGEPLAVLSASNRALRVYHTPQVQRLVGEIVDRFVNSETESRAFSLQIVSVADPSWRTRAHRMLRPLPTHTPGIQAWLLEKEDATLLLGELHRRSDFREHSSLPTIVANGQPKGVSWSHDRAYTRDVLLRGDAWPGYELDAAKADEGFSLEFTPLLAMDGQTVDAMIRCDVQQVEKLIPVTIDAPTTASPRQRAELQVPQIAATRLHERFRWPVQYTLLVDLGMVSMPSATEQKSLLGDISLPFLTPSARADLMVFVQSQTEATTAGRGPRLAERDARTYRGRY